MVPIATARASVPGRMRTGATCSGQVPVKTQGVAGPRCSELCSFVTFLGKGRGMAIPKDLGVTLGKRHVGCGQGRLHRH